MNTQATETALGIDPGFGDVSSESEQIAIETQLLQTVESCQYAEQVEQLSQFTRVPSHPFHRLLGKYTLQMRHSELGILDHL